MRMVLTFEFDSDIIDGPQRVIEERERLKDAFYDWLYDRSNHHRFWANEKGVNDGSQYSVVYRSDAFLEWLNARVLGEKEKASLIASEVDTWDPELPSLRF